MCLPDHREVDGGVLVRPTAEGGGLVMAFATGVITMADVRGDLHELCRGDVPGRTEAGAITRFENGGGGHLDVMTAPLLWLRYQDER